MFLRSYIAKHRATVPTDLRRSNPRRKMIVPRSNVGRQWPERIERGFVAPLDLLLHVLLNQVHRNMAWPFIHDLATFGPSSLSQFTLDFQLRQLSIIVRVSNRTWSQPVSNRETHIVSRTDIADIIPMFIQKILFLVMHTPLG